MVFVAMVIPAFLAPAIGHISDKVKYLKEEKKTVPVFNYYYFWYN